MLYHRPYFPDITPSEYRLSPKLKEHPRGRRFLSVCRGGTSLFPGSGRNVRGSLGQVWLQGDHVKKSRRNIVSGTLRNIALAYRQRCTLHASPSCGEHWQDIRNRPTRNLNYKRFFFLGVGWGGIFRFALVFYLIQKRVNHTKSCMTRIFQSNQSSHLTIPGFFSFSSEHDPEIVARPGGTAIYPVFEGFEAQLWVR